MNNELTFKCVACTSKLSKKNTTYYLVGIVLPDGNLCQLFSPKKFNEGDNVTCVPCTTVVGKSVIPSFKIKTDVANV